MGRAHEVRAKAMAATAAAKTKLYSRYGKEIMLAIKAGGPDPEANLTLRSTIERAKKAQVPGDLIKRALDKAKSGAADNLVEIQYEGFGPGASTLIVDCLTDNTNRALSEVRSTINKMHGKFAVSGAVSHNYDHVAYITVKGSNEDAVLEALLMAEIDVKSVETDEDLVVVTGEPSARNAITTAIAGIEGAEIETDEITYIPSDGEYVTLEGEDKEFFEKLIETLEECDDVDEVYHNVDL